MLRRTSYTATHRVTWSSSLSIKTRATTDPAAMSPSLPAGMASCCCVTRPAAGFRFPAGQGGPPQRQDAQTPGREAQPSGRKPFLSGRAVHRAAGNPKSPAGRSSATQREIRSHTVSITQQQETNNREQVPSIKEQKLMSNDQ